jgi:hypothetical protein
MCNDRGTVGNVVFCVVRDVITETSLEVSRQSICEEKIGRMVQHGRQPGSWSVESTKAVGLSPDSNNVSTKASEFPLLRSITRK